MSYIRLLSNMIIAYAFVLLVLITIHNPFTVSAQPSNELYNSGISIEQKYLN